MFFVIPERVMRMKKFIWSLLFLAVASLLFSFYSYSKQMAGTEVEMEISWDGESSGNRITRSYVQVPSGGYNDVFSEMFGEEDWDAARQLYRKKFGLTRFMPGDVFSVSSSGDRILSFDLHHYKNRTSGEKYTIRKVGEKYRKEKTDISLEVKTVVRHFTIKESLAQDNPSYYELAKERLLWDWGVLDKLEPGDSISFMIKGIFDDDIIIHTFGIQGFSVKSKALGEFSLVAYRDYHYGDYFIPGNRMMLSPPGELRVPLDHGRITSHFGYRTDPFNKRKRFHNGIDIVAKTNTPVKAAEAGTVIFVGRKGRLGKTVVIRHDDGMKTIYGHLNRYHVASGQKVLKGENIAGVGSTGRSTAPHLHFAVLVDEKPVDPLSFTYERIWTAPFDIDRDFRTVSIERSRQMEQALTQGRTMFIKEQFAEAPNATKAD
jgi:murein DD-endopeptidase MepM/ murein hydrolase activator NlpD